MNKAWRQRLEDAEAAAAKARAQLQVAAWAREVGGQCGCGSKPMVPFWGRCTTHVRTYFSGDWDVHWGYGILPHGQVAMQLEALAGLAIC